MEWRVRHLSRLENLGMSPVCCKYAVRSCGGESKSCPAQEEEEEDRVIVSYALRAKNTCSLPDSYCAHRYCSLQSINPALTAVLAAAPIWLPLPVVVCTPAPWCIAVFSAGAPRRRHLGVISSRKISAEAADGGSLLLMLLFVVLMMQKLRTVTNRCYRSCSVVDGNADRIIASCVLAS